jgi:hypothetical protein
MHASTPSVIPKPFFDSAGLFCRSCRLRKMGLEPVIRDAAPAGKQYPYVLFAAPPSGSEDYPAAVSRPTHSLHQPCLLSIHSQQWLATCIGRLNSSMVGVCISGVRHAASVEGEQLTAVHLPHQCSAHAADAWLLTGACVSPVSRCAVPQVRAATQQWDGSGSFVFTSSMSVCATEDGSEVSENCPLVPQGKAPGARRECHSI